MKITAMAMITVLAGVAAQAKSPVQLEDPMRVTVCMQSLADFGMMARTQGVAAKMFAGIPGKSVPDPSALKHCCRLWAVGKSLSGGRCQSARRRISERFVAPESRVQSLEGG